MPRLASAVILLGLVLAGCGGGTKTVTETQTTAATAPQGTATQEATITEAGTTVTSPARLPSVPAGTHGPHYFETPSHNIGCYVSAHDARCDIRERTWSPPPEPKSCIKIGLDYGQGIVVGPDRAEFICAGDTVLGGPAILPYRRSAQRGTLLCVSRVAGVTCRNTANGHGFFLSRGGYRIF
jgi:hypothetical protein